MTSLLYTARYGFADAMRLLLDRGARVEVEDSVRIKVLFALHAVSYCVIVRLVIMHYGLLAITDTMLVSYYFCKKVQRSIKNEQDI